MLMRKQYLYIANRRIIEMAVDLNNAQLKGLRMRLKSGEYDGVHLTKAWLAIDELIDLRGKVERIKSEVDLLAERLHRI